MNDKKNVLIIVLLVTIVAMAVGYAALSETLVIAGTANINADWNVQISSIEADELVGATVNEAKTTSATAATFSVDLAYPGAYATFEVETINKGTIDAKFDEFSDLTATNAEDPDYIIYTVSGISKDDKLLANEANTHTATITVTWDGDAEETPAEAVTKTATINLEYVQAD